jgi:hypothetical protein
MTEAKIKLKELVGKDELDEAIKYLKSHIRNDSKHDMVILLWAKLSQLKKQLISGTIDSNSADLAKNSIRNSLLEIINSLDGDINSQPSKENKSTQTIEQNHFGKGDNIGKNKIIHKNESKPFWKR